MAVAAVSLKILPCPYCHQPVDEHQSVLRETVRHGVDCLELQCGSCGKNFTHYRQLTRSAEAMPAAARALAAATAPPKPVEKAPDAITWLLATGTAVFSEYLTRGMSGQTFLVLYGALFIAAYASALGSGLRRRLVSLFTFELAGGLRLHHALGRGHHNLSFLVLMMIIGGILLLVEWDSGGGGGQPSSGSFFSGGYDPYYHSYHHHCSGCGGGWWGGGGGGGSSGGSSGGGGGCGGCGS